MSDGRYQRAAAEKARSLSFKRMRLLRMVAVIDRELKALGARPGR